MHDSASSRSAHWVSRVGSPGSSPELCSVAGGPLTAARKRPFRLPLRYTLSRHLGSRKETPEDCWGQTRKWPNSAAASQADL